MDEERQITRQTDDSHENGDLDEEGLLSDDLEIPEQEERVIRQAIGMFMGFARPASNPLLSRFTSEHITQILNARENNSLRSHERGESEARRAHSAGNSERWLAAWFGTLILAAAVGLIIFFGIRETYEVVTAIIGGLLGFAGGFGVGRMRR